MIKVKAIQDFTLKEFDKIENLKRGSARNRYGEIYLDDSFECDERMAKYLMGKNEKGACVVKTIEVIPEKN